MSDFYHGLDLKRGALVRAGEIPDGTSAYDGAVMKYINQIYHAIFAGSNEFEIDLGEPWYWAKQPSPVVINLEPPYQTGTVSVANGSASGTFSAAPSFSLQGQFLKVTDNVEYYKILSHTAGATAFTLDSTYNGTTNAAAGFKVFRLVYTVRHEDVFARFITPFRVFKTTFEEDEDYQIYGISDISFDRDYPLSVITSSTPTRFKLGKDASGNYTVQFNYYVTETTRIEAEWIAIPEALTDSTTSVPKMPRNFRPVLEYGAAAMIAQDKNDARLNNFISLVQSKMRSMIADNRKQHRQINGKNRGMLLARQDQLGYRSRLGAYIEGVE